MGLTKALLSMALGVLLAAGSAVAKPPPADELPRLRDVVEEIRKDLEEAERKAAEDARDVDQEFLDQYAAETIGSDEDHRRIVKIIDDRSLEREKPGIRDKAAKIVARRWPDGKAKTLRAKKFLTVLLIPLLGQRGHDEKSNTLAIGVLKAMWGTDRGYKLDSSWRDKNDAIRNWKRASKK